MNAQNNFHNFLTAHCADTMESHESAIGILYDYYAESNEGADPQIRATLKKLRGQLTTADTDSIMNTVFELCSLPLFDRYVRTHGSHALRGFKAKRD